MENPYHNLSYLVNEGFSGLGVRLSLLSLLEVKGKEGERGKVKGERSKVKGQRGKVKGSNFM